MNTSTSSTSQGQLIAVASGKGGVGKTWFSITLAHMLARSGRRVLLFDGDIGLANVDVQLGIHPDFDLGNVYAGKCALEDAIIPYDKGGFDVIAGRSGSGSTADMSLEHLQRIGKTLSELVSQYDFVIIDLGAGIDKSTRYLASLAQKALIVVTEEPTSLTDAYAFIKLSQSMPKTPHVQVVVNQASTQKDGQKTYDSLNRACTSFLNISPPCVGIIRKDNKVRDAIRSQQSMIITAPHSTAATDVAQIAIKLMKA